VRGDARVDIEWKDGKLSRLKIQSNGRKFHLTYGTQAADVQIVGTHVFDGNLQPIRN
jgi:hypothetical protein